MQTMFNLRIGELPLMPQPDMTFHTLLHVNSPDCCLLQVMWSRESEADKQECMKKNKNKNQSECDLYYKYDKEGDKHASDLKYLGVNVLHCRDSFRYGTPFP
jgi:hypothetical protein